MTAAATRAPIAQAVAAAMPAPAAQPEQLALLPPSKFGPDTQRHRVMREHVARHDRGRPPGATNLVTRDALDFVRKVIGDPMIERARWLRHTPASLAAELKCTELEAFDRLDRIRSELMGLFYPRLAPVDGQGNVVPPTLIMAFGGGARGPGGTDLPPWLQPQNMQPVQALEAPADPVSHDPVSHGDGK